MLVAFELAGRPYTALNGGPQFTFTEAISLQVSARDQDEVDGYTERLAHLLLHLVDTYGVKDPEGVLIGAAFTHADLAHMVGATRQWVTISLKRLQDQGVVVSRKSRIVIRKIDAANGVKYTCK